MTSELICEECGKQLEQFKRAHDCDGGEALRKAAHELFAPCVDLIERTIAKAGTGVLRGVFEVAAERDLLRNSHAALSATCAELTAANAALREALEEAISHVERHCEGADQLLRNLRKALARATDKQS